MSNLKPQYAQLTLPSVIMPWVLLCILIIATEFLHQRVQQLNQQQELILTESYARELARTLEYELNASVLATQGLASYIASHAGQFDGEAIEPWLMPLINSDNHFRNLAIAPGNTVTYVFPLEGNEEVIGLHYPRNRKQWPAIETIILSRKPMLAGPVSLVQGGLGLIYRFPVYIDRHYWGLLSTVINADSLFSEVEQRAEQMRIRIALIDGKTNRKFWRLVWGDAALVDSTTDTIKLHIPGRNWQLLAQPQRLSSLSENWTRLSGWSLAILLCLLCLVVNRKRFAKTSQ